MEPRTFEDLWLMRETSNAWFDGRLSYEDVRKGADPEVGMVDGVSLHVVPFSDRVRVCRNTYVICEVQGGELVLLPGRGRDRGRVPVHGGVPRQRVVGPDHGEARRR